MGTRLAKFSCCRTHLCFCDDVGGQFNHCKVPLPDGTLHFVVPDPHGASNAQSTVAPSDYYPASHFVYNTGPTHARSRQPKAVDHLPLTHSVHMPVEHVPECRRLRSLAAGGGGEGAYRIQPGLIHFLIFANKSSAFVSLTFP